MPNKALTFTQNVCKPVFLLVPIFPDRGRCCALVCIWAWVRFCISQAYMFLQLLCQDDNNNSTHKKIHVNNICVTVCTFTHTYTHVKYTCTDKQTNKHTNMHTYALTDTHKYTHLRAHTCKHIDKKHAFCVRKVHNAMYAYNSYEGK